MSVALWVAVDGGQKLRPGECRGPGGDTAEHGPGGDTAEHGRGEGGKCLPVLWDSPPSSLARQM